MTPIRILQVCNTDFYLNRFLRPLVLALKARGHDVHCVCGGTKIHPELLDAAIPVFDFDYPRRSSPADFAQGILRMRRIIRDGRYDCVNSHNRNASVVGRVASWLEGVPLNLYTAHGFYFQDGQTRPLQLAAIAIEAGLARITDHTLSQSREDEDFMVGRGLIAAGDITTIGNGIDAVRFRPRAAEERAAAERDLGLRHGVFRVAGTGRLVQGKGFVDLLDAFAIFHRAHAESELVLIGGNIDQDLSPFRDEFLGRVREHGLDHAVRITGITDRVHDYIAATDVFVLPSYREGMPRSLLEAMAAETPVIATDIRGCREIVSHGWTGWLYPPHDVETLAALIERVYDSPEERRKEMGRRARAVILDRFTEPAYVERQVEAIERLTAAAPKRRRHLRIAQLARSGGMS